MTLVLPGPEKNRIVRISDQSAKPSAAEELEWGMRLPFNPRYTSTLLDLEKFEDLDVETIRHYVSGLVLSVSGTLISHGSEDFSPAVVKKLREIRAKMQVCVFPNHGEEHTLFHTLKIPIVNHAAPKPDMSGFERAAYQYMNLKPQQCATVGSNLLKESGALKAGMRIILVNHLPGKESLFDQMGRGYSHLVKKMHDTMYNRIK